MKATLLLALSVAFLSPARVEQLTLLETLNAELLASTSATFTLEAWCADHRMATEPKIVAIRIRTVQKQPGAAVLRRLDVRAASEVRYRRVELRCGAHVMSEADNWYVPSRLTPEMNTLLETTDTPFGKAVQPLHPYRRTIGVAMLWVPMVAIPTYVFEHRAVLYTADHRPFSEVVENVPLGRAGVWEMTQICG